MPMLDVGFITNDPMLSEVFTVERRPEVIGDDGRVHINKQVIPNVRGVVTQDDPSDLTRSESGQMVPRVIQINSTFQFREATIGFQPDRVLWNGASYLVKKIYPYSHFGKGHSRVTLESVAGTDPPQAT